MTEPSETYLREISSLVTKLARLSNSMKAQQHFSKQQLILLRTLFQRGASTVSELAEQLQLSVSATTVALNRLVKSGHVLRKRDETDRRVVWVEITESAAALMQELDEQRMGFLGRLLRHLSEEEQRQFSMLLHKILQQEER